MTRSNTLLFGLLLACGPSWAASRAPRVDDASFQKTVAPFLAQNCTTCHNAKIKTADLDLDSYRDADSALQHREVWEDVLEKLRNGQMPPKGVKQPSPADIQAVEHWIETELARIDSNTKPDPGRVTAHRLNRFEYNNTVRDLLAVDFHPADDFPADDAGYGFDNIGDVLSLSPVLMEKYLAAAERIAKKAVFGDPILKPTQERYKAEILKPGEPRHLSLDARHSFPVDAEYEIRSGFTRRPAAEAPVAAKLTLWMDDRPVKVFDIPVDRTRPAQLDARLPVKEGEHRLRASILYDPPAEPGRGPSVEFIEVRGPFHGEARRPLGEATSAFFVCSDRTPECARRILAGLAHRTYRRPATGREVDGLVQFVTMAQKQGDSFEQGIQLALEAVLVSPHFLYCIEHDSKPTDPAAVHSILFPVGQHAGRRTAGCGGKEDIAQAGCPRSSGTAPRSSGALTSGGWTIPAC